MKTEPNSGGGNRWREREEGTNNQRGNGTATTKPAEQSRLRELVAKMARLRLIREEPSIPQTGPVAGVRPSLIVHLLTKYHTLAGVHLRQLCYFHLTPGSQLKCYYRETKRLVDQGFIMREWQAEREDNVYWLGEWGRMLAEINGKRLRGDRRLLWGHDLLVADFMSWVISGARRSGGVAEWLGEYEVNLSPELRPDARGIIRISGRELRFYLEADTGTEAENVFAQKYDKYHRYLKSTAGAGAGSVVLAITKGKQERLSRMIMSLRERQRVVGAGVTWLLTTEELMKQTDSASGPGPTFERIWYDLEAQARRPVWPV